MKVTKRNGEVENFDSKKVIRSLRNSGVSETAITTVIKEIENRSFASISTDKLYNLIYTLVRKLENKYSASIYSLKQSIMRLGPDGYAFEDFIAKILSQEGYKIRVRQIAKSKCISHELDVVGEDFFAECKYHNRGGIHTSVKDVMYSYARFLDLKEASKHWNKLWVVTNTKFSRDAIDYAEYWKIKLLSWKYKGNESLSYIIDKNFYYPITILPSISKNIFKIFNQHNILLLTEVCSLTDAYLKKIGIYKEEIKKIRNDCKKIREAATHIKKEDNGKI